MSASRSELSQARGLRKRQSTLQAKIRSNRTPARGRGHDPNTSGPVCAHVGSCIRASATQFKDHGRVAQRTLHLSMPPERMKSMTSTHAKLQRAGCAFKGRDAQDSSSQWAFNASPHQPRHATTNSSLQHCGAGLTRLAGHQVRHRPRPLQCASRMDESVGGVNADDTCHERCMSHIFPIEAASSPLRSDANASPAFESGAQGECVSTNRTSHIQGML